MKEYKATITIDAPLEKIWSILINVSAWPKWDPNCDKVEGTVALGHKLKVFTKLSPGRAFPVKVARLEPSRLMVWTGGMPFGLFKGERTYALAPKNGSGVVFTMHEIFSGPMLALIGKSIPDMTKAFQQFALGLKACSERTTER